MRGKLTLNALREQHNDNKNNIDNKTWEFFLENYSW